MKKLMIVMVTGMLIIPLQAQAFGLGDLGSIKSAIESGMNVAKASQSKDNIDVAQDHGSLSRFDRVVVQDDFFTDHDTNDALRSKLASMFAESKASAASVDAHGGKQHMAGSLSVCMGSECNDMIQASDKGEVAIVRIVHREDGSALGKLNSMQLSHAQIKVFDAAEPDKMLSDKPIELEKGLISDKSDENVGAISTFVMSMVVKLDNVKLDNGKKKGLMSSLF